MNPINLQVASSIYTSESNSNSRFNKPRAQLEEEVPPHASSATGQVQSWTTESTKKDNKTVTPRAHEEYFEECIHHGLEWGLVLEMVSILAQKLRSALSLLGICGGLAPLATRRSLQVLGKVVQVKTKRIRDPKPQSPHISIEPAL